MKLEEFVNIRDKFTHWQSSIVESSFDDGVMSISEKFYIIKPKLKHDERVNNSNSHRKLYNLSLLSKVLEWGA